MFSMIPYRTNRSLRTRDEDRDFFNPFADEFFRSFFNDDRYAGGMKVDVEDKGDHYLLEADLPGVSRENLHVDVDNGVMTITAEVKESTEEKKKNYVCHERRWGTTSRSFNLDGIHEEAISGEFKDGVLKLTLPKETESKPTTRKIESA